ncbi:MAG: homoserine O-acetyltransferase/O-succinyltransferase family protein [Oscillospiraceae bacterium]
MTGHSNTTRGRWSRNICAIKTPDFPSMCRRIHPDDDDTKPPMVTWRSHANLLYQNWLNYFVYQTTPYDLSAIRPV